MCCALRSMPLVLTSSVHDRSHLTSQKWNASALRNKSFLRVRKSICPCSSSSTRTSWTTQHAAMSTTSFYHIPSSGTFLLGPHLGFDSTFAAEQGETGTATSNLTPLKMSFRPPWVSTSMSTGLSPARHKTLLASNPIIARLMYTQHRIIQCILPHLRLY